MRSTLVRSRSVVCVAMADYTHTGHRHAQVSSQPYRQLARSRTDHVRWCVRRVERRAEAEVAAAAVQRLQKSENREKLYIISGRRSCRNILTTTG